MWRESKMDNDTGKKLHKDNRGTSMVTVIISFALLLLCVVSYFRVQKVVENMMMSSKDTILNNSNLIKAYYMDETGNVKVGDGETLQFVGADGDFSINVTLMRAQKEGLNGSIYYFEEK